MIQSQALREKYRAAQKYFSRNRVLTFPLVLSIVLQKSAKSMQNVLNELFEKRELAGVSSSAFTQARSHLKHEVFIELNRAAVVDVCYGDGEYERYKGYRLLAVDGSKIYLPNEPAIREAFGGHVVNQYVKQVYPFALGSVLYDVLNHIVIDGKLAPADSYEVDLALEHVEQTTEEDLLLFDRGYPTYRLLATLTQQARNFVVRCPKSSFSAVRHMVRGQGPDSQIVTLPVPAHQRGEVEAQALPSAITVRLVRVWLDSGEMEVLLTSLQDERAHPTADFKHLYSLRWGVETFYDLLKNRLQIEHFSGKSVESVKQDFFAALYLSGLETLLIGRAQTLLQERSQSNQYPLQVNHAVAFNALKHQVIDLLIQPALDEQALLDKLTHLFLQKPTAVRKNRSIPRRKPTAAKALHFHKRTRKICF